MGYWICNVCNVRNHSYASVHTGDWAHRQRVSITFFDWQTHKFFLCSWRGSNLRSSSDLESCRPDMTFVVDWAWKNNYLSDTHVVDNGKIFQSLKVTWEFEKNNLKFCFLVDRVQVLHVGSFRRCCCCFCCCWIYICFTPVVDIL